MHYYAIKHLHVTAAVLSILFFVIRAYWSVSESALLKKGFVRIAPHVVDTVLLVCGIILAAMIGPSQPWILAKVVALIGYIGIGSVAIKHGKTPRSRAIAALMAVIVFLYIVGAAMQKTPMSWLG